MRLTKDIKVSKEKLVGFLGSLEAIEKIHPTVVEVRRVGSLIAFGQPYVALLREPLGRRDVETLFTGVPDLPRHRFSFYAHVVRGLPINTRVSLRGEYEVMSRRVTQSRVTARVYVLDNLPRVLSLGLWIKVRRLHEAMLDNLAREVEKL